MPIYEYRCRACGEKFETFRAISASDEEVACPKCGKRDSRRIISSFSSRKSAGEAGNLTFRST